MSPTEILIIDHDDMVLGLLRGSIVAKDPGAIIDIVKSRAEADLKFQSHLYHCIFCDYDILSENEFELMSHILAGPEKEAEVIVTCYGNPADFNFDPYPAPKWVLSKPVDQRNLSNLLTQLVGVKTDGASDVGISEDTSKSIEKTLKELQHNTNARCIMVCNQDGRVIVQQGETENIAVDSLASLVSGSIISLEEVGRIFNDPTVINLAFREGAKVDLYVMNIGQRLMLIMIQDKSMISPKIGTVWFYARHAAITIHQLISESTTMKKKLEPTG
ncbi:MAG: roadblock/LC7 domain-containing protein [Anaerolineaceae bacterium]|nr:roadblock/LC7 domain-containing protein [Anaerolineaceae bacterium]MBN2677646.1 roadblock/LC7 domain-containing protein [Anaerolineaceae bacterium]